MDMGAQRTSFEKLQRDRAKKAKQAAKREKRAEKGTEADPSAGEVFDVTSTLTDDGKELSAADLLNLVEAIHQQFEAKEISLEEFEEKKTELFGRLPIE
jgi:hypothetical protein